MSKIYTPVPCKGVDSRVLASAWGLHPSFTALAVASEGGTVEFYQEEGDCLDARTVRKGSTANATALAWSPSRPLLAIGWSNGTLSIWTESSGSGQTSDEMDLHFGKTINVLQWSPDGSRLVSGDSAGRVGVWKVDPMGRLSKVCVHQRTGAITHIVFKPPPKAKSAAASIASNFAAAEQPPFYFANEGGAICIADDMGRCHDAVSLGLPLAALLYYGAREQLVVLSKSLVLAQFRAEAGGKMSQVQKVKLSVTGGAEVGLLGCAWLVDGQLATVSAERIVRVWDLAAEENYVLRLGDDGGALAADKAVTVAYHAGKRVLAVGTAGGKVALWALHAAGAAAGAPVDETSWRPLRPIDALDDGAPVRALAWAPGTHLLAAAGEACVAVCAQSTLARLVRGDWALVQLSAYAFALEHVTSGVALALATKMRARGADMWGNRVLLWNGTRAEVHELSAGAHPSLELVSSFRAQSLTLALHAESVYVVTDGRLDVANLKGVVRSTLPFLEAEGAPVLLDISKSMLCACTAKGVLRVWDISRNEPRQLASRAFDAPGAGAVVSIRVNSFGSAVSLLTQPPADAAAAAAAPRARAPALAAGGAAVSGAGASGELSACVYAYLLDANAFARYDFGEHGGGVPVEHAWDATDPKLLGVLTEPRAPPPPAEGGGGAAAAADAARGARGEQPSYELTTLFATADHGLLLQDSFALPAHVESLLALACPRIYFAGPPAPTASPPPDDAPAGSFARGGRGGSAGGGGGYSGEIPFERVQGFSRVTSRMMRDFAGIELPRGGAVDGAVREALLAFSFHLTVGNMDEAYKAVRAIKSTSVWENMARMCVKTRRLDVAEVCLGNMGHARGAAALAAAAAEPEPEARIAMLAVQLAMLDDAARLYAGCGRYDLLNEMYQAAGRWDDALALAKEHDRIHLATTYHQYARHLEASGDEAGAIQAYERAGTHLTNVPRMLWAAGRRAELKAYVDRAAVPELYVWWAKYCESAQDFGAALEYYERARDQLARVRVLCHCGRLDEAAELVNESNDAAAAYHLARQYEAEQMVKPAIQLFTRAGKYNQAARLAKEHGLPQELAALSLQAPAQMQSEAAAFFEQHGQYDKAVQMYHKSNRTQYAIELCFQHNLFAPLRDIANSLGADAEPAVLQRCGQFFVEHGHFDKAVSLLLLARQHHEALELCVQHNITISEEMADGMAPAAKLDDPTAEARRVETLLKIAKCCKRQGSYHLATQKYTQAGDKVKAMKCLLKSGDTDKIVFFAGVSRAREIYILGANYLQNLDWHSEPEVLRRIVEFYTKAKALEQLAAFYEACAMVEVDEFRDYDKAADALREAAGAWERSRAPGREDKVASLQHRVALVERFIGARQIVKTDPQAMINTCGALLSEMGVEGAIRVGDIFALLVEWFASQRDYQQAYAMIEKMRARDILLAPYLDAELIETVYRAVGLQPEVESDMRRGPAQSVKPEDDDEVLDEELDD